MPGFDSSKFAARFVTESREKLSGIREQLASGPLSDHPDSLDAVRKYVHGLNGVANMLKFSTIGQLAAEFEGILKSLVDGKRETRSWIHQLVDRFATVVDEELVRIESDARAEQHVHPFLDQLKSIAAGADYAAESHRETDKPDEDKRFSKERFLKKFLEEATGYIRELENILQSVQSAADLAGKQTDLKNVAHAFKGSSRLLGFDDLSGSLEKLEDFFIDNIKTGRTLPAHFRTDFQQVILTLQAALKRISGEDSGGDTNLTLAETVEKIIAPVSDIPTEKPQAAAVPVPEPPAPREPEVKAVSQPAAQPAKKFDRSIFISKFVDESIENIDLLGDTLLQLEQSKGNQDLTKECMRLAHILKGSARMIGFKYQGAVLHKMEDLLNEFVNNGLVMTDPHVELLLVASDHLKENLHTIKREQAEMQPLTTLTEALDAAVARQPFTIPAVANRNLSELPGDAPKQDPTRAPAPSQEKVPERRMVEPTPQPVEETQEKIYKIEPEPGDPPGPPSKDVTIRKFGDTIRVNTNKLDETIKLVGELLINRQRSQIRLTELQHLRKLMKNFVYQLSTMVQGSEDESTREIVRQAERFLSMLEGQAHRQREDMAFQDLIINELQNNTIKMRMEPLNVIFNAFPRAVRDMAKALNKQVELVIQGDETELDRKMIEKLTDPMIHLLRNAIDHGIESPEEREKMGKPQRGLVRIRASAEGSNIVILIQDDGRGIDIDRIKEKALSKKLFDSKAEVDALNEVEVMKLIFMPNFSTAKIITDLSGRGVGLDIVKKNIEDLKGFISVDSIFGRGTTFTIKLPLTLTTLRAIICTAGAQKWAIPISAIRRTLVIRKSEVIEVVDRDAIRLDNQIIPLVRLSKTLDLKDENDFPEKLMVIVGYFGKEQIAFVVDDIAEETEIVIKPIPILIKKVKNISSVTVSLNGEIIPILFMPELLNSAKLVQEGLKEPVMISKARENIHKVLVVDDSLNTREIEKTILEAYGYQVETARDGVDGYEKAMEGTYDIIVSDLEMPRLNGFGMIEKLRQESKYSTIPIVIVTSRENENDKRRGIEVGANAYIIKGSFDQTSLIDTIESLLA